MGQIIDRRLNDKKKSAVNRQRFIRRFKQQIKKAVIESVSERSITDMDNSEKINIPARDISEPVFRHGQGGRDETVHPGNTDFIPGDKLKRPSGGSGGGGDGEASNEGEGSDDFSFELSREEFLEFFFEDLALPDLTKTQLATVIEYQSVRAGYSSSGVPTNINIVRSLKGALGRRMALKGPLKKRLREAELALAARQETHADQSNEGIVALQEEIIRLKRRIKSVPFIDTFDLRYNNRVLQAKPSTQAVMFCLMDVSGSMDQARKDVAKRFFILLYLFLSRSYEHIDLVFIRHHTIAKEVDEDEFFHSRETGGTVVSSALEMMRDIIKERYPTSEWNIYAAQASDGDNWHDDSPLCRGLLDEQIMPLVQYFAYVEIMADRHQRLWDEYALVQANHSNFAMQDIATAEDIFPVFRELFKKQTT